MDIDALRQYEKRTLFEEWEEFVEPAQLKLTRTLFVQLLQALVQAAEQGQPEQVFMDHMQHCVEALNELEEKDAFIYTIEREHLCDELYSIGDLCDFPDEAWVDRWRDW